MIEKKNFPLWGEKNRKKHFETHNIKQLVHLPLFIDHKTEYGEILTNEYYVFESEPKAQELKGKIQYIVGSHIGKKILTFLGKTPISLSYIFNNESSSTVSKDGKSTGLTDTNTNKNKNKNKNNNQYSEFNFEIMIAISLMSNFLFKKMIPEGTLAIILKNIQDSPMVDIKKSNIKSLNTIFINTNNNMTKMLNALSKKSKKNIKNLKFPKIKEVLEELRIPKEQNQFL